MVDDDDAVGVEGLLLRAADVAETLRYATAGWGGWLWPSALIQSLFPAELLT